jgi:hypothetical protein
MRVYLRHPSEFPVELRAADQREAKVERLHDLSVGGLCCRSGTSLTPGEHVRIRIRVGLPGFEADGRVAWCRPHDDGFRVGVEFVSQEEAMRARMVEQVCHMERYHQQLVAEGRNVSREEAALEWVAKYAAQFPR